MRKKARNSWSLHQLIALTFRLQYFILTCFHFCINALPVSRHLSLIGLSCSSPLPSLSQIATFPLLSSSLFMRAVQSARALEVLMNEGTWRGEVLGGGDGVGGSRGVGSVAHMVVHLPAPHPAELGMTHFLRRPRLSAPPNQPLYTHPI